MTYLACSESTENETWMTISFLPINNTTTTFEIMQLYNWSTIFVLNNLSQRNIGKMNTAMEYDGFSPFWYKLQTPVFPIKNIRRIKRSNAHQIPIELYISTSAVLKSAVVFLDKQRIRHWNSALLEVRTCDLSAERVGDFRCCNSARSNSIILLYSILYDRRHYILCT